jgi:hypothetical protein
MDPIPIFQRLPEAFKPVLAYSPLHDKWWVVYIDDTWSPPYWMYQHGGTAEPVFERDKVKIHKFTHWCELPDVPVLHSGQKDRGN